MNYEVLHESKSNEYGSSTNKSSIIIKDQNSYDAELLSRTSDATKTVNFEEETLLLIDMGTRSSGGQSIQVDSFVDKGEYIRATIAFILPGNNCITSTATTNPFQMIKLDTTKDVLITEKRIISDC